MVNYKDLGLVNTREMFKNLFDVIYFYDYIRQFNLKIVD